MRVVAFFSSAVDGCIGRGTWGPWHKSLRGVGRESLAIASGCATQGDRSKIKATGRVSAPLGGRRKVTAAFAEGSFFAALKALRNPKSDVAARLEAASIQKPSPQWTYEIA
jgi:hypothetical protein